MSWQRGTAILLCAFLGTLPVLAQPVVDHPDELTYSQLSFEVPRAEGFRHEIAGGVPVYVVEDHALPLVTMAATVRVGGFLDPVDMTGLASLTGTMLRQGGAADLSAREFDERADFLAADIVTSTGDTSGRASVNCVKRVLDDCLDLYFSMLREPRFEAGRLEVEKGNLLEQMKQRNDHPASILSREWQWLLYGREHFSSTLPTHGSLEAIARQDLVEFHRRWWRPASMVLAVSGDVDTEAILATLEERLADWPTPTSETGTEAAEAPWPPSSPDHEPDPGIYHVEKQIPQGRVQIGHLGLQWTDWSDPQHYAATVMNEILGGGGFTSRITKRIRSDEGLAYSAGSRLGIGVFWPGTFYVYYQSKNPTIALAADIAYEELERIGGAPVSDEELTTAKNSFVDTFPRRFETAADTVNLFATDEYLGRPHSYWYEYRDRIDAVTADDVRAAARRLLHPERTVFLIVGPWSEIAPGDAEGRASMEGIVERLGEVTHLPLRDPLTLEPRPAE